MAEIRTFRRIETPERVSLTMELSGIPARLTAAVIDGFILLWIEGISQYLLWQGNGLLARLEMLPKGLAVELLQTVAPLLALATLLLYTTLQEWRWGGQTIGKRLLGIRVLRVNGQPLGFWEAFGRSLFRLIDTPLGLLFMLFSDSEQRLGDRVCGTVVVLARPSAATDLPVLDVDKTSTGAPDGDDAGASLASRLTAGELALLGAYRLRRSQLNQAPRQAFAAALNTYVARRLDMPVDQLPESLAAD